MAVRATPMVCPEERPLVRPQVQTLYPIGMPTPRRGCRGERREARAQWAQPLNAVSAPEFRQTTSGAHGSANRADCLPRGKPPVRPQAHTPAPVGIGAPTPARIGTCRPKGRSHFSFGGERKVCKRKPAARRLREKALYCPFWRRGSLCRAQHNWTANIDVRARSELAFFRRQNGRAFFPPLPIAALLPRSWRLAGAPLAGWDASVHLGNFCGGDEWAAFPFPG